MFLSLPVFVGKHIQFDSTIKSKQKCSFIRTYVSSQNVIFLVCVSCCKTKLKAIWNRLNLIPSVYWDILLLIVHRIMCMALLYWVLWSSKKNHICQSSLRSYCSIHFSIFFTFDEGKANGSQSNWLLSANECVWFIQIDSITCGPVAFGEYRFEWSARVSEQASKRMIYKIM